MLQALALQPSKGQHMLYSNLSAAHLQLGRHEAALQAAKASVDLAPKGFHMVGSCMGSCPLESAKPSALPSLCPSLFIHGGSRPTLHVYGSSTHKMLCDSPGCALTVEKCSRATC
jgi:hypothetical protein